MAQPPVPASQMGEQKSFAQLDPVADLDLRIAQVRLRKRTVLATDIFLYSDQNGEIFVPFDLAMEWFGFQIGLDASGRVSGWFLRETQRVEIDPGTVHVSIAGTTRDLDPRQLVRIDGQLYIALSALQSWFRLGPEWDPSRQILSFDPPYLLTSEEASRRGQRAFGGHSAPSIDTSGFEVIAPDYNWIGWPYVSANFALTADSGEGRLSAQGGLLAQGDILKASGQLALTADTRGLATARFTLGRRDPLGQQLGVLGASVVEIGDLAAPSTPLLQRNAFGVGLRIGREPLDQGGDFDETDLIGDAPPGWQAELFRDSELLGFQVVGADGRYAFQAVPIRFGINRFRIELYGPSGERQTVDRVVDVAQNLVQPGALRYNFLALREGSGLFDGLLNGSSEDEGLDLEPQPETPRAFFDRRAIYLEARASYGVSSNLGINALASWRRLDGAGRDTINLGTGFALRTGSVLLSGDALIQQNGAWAGRGLISFSLGSFSASASHEQYSTDFRSNENEFGDAVLQSRSQISLDGRVGALGVGLSAEQTVRQTGESDERLALRINASLAGISLSKRLSLRRMGRAGTSEGVSSNQGSFSSADGAFLAAGSIGGFRLRAGFDYELSPRLRPIRAVGELSYRVDDWFMTLRTQRDLRRSDGQWGFAVNRDWNGIRLGADLRYEERNRNWRGFLTLSLPIDRDPRSGGLRFGRSARGNRGSVLASAFLDTNVNGRRDENEEGVGDVGFEVSPRGLVSSGEGASLIENLPVDREVALLPDLQHVDDPYLVTTKPGYVLTPRTGSIATIDVPLVESGEVVVTLVKPDAAPLTNKIISLEACSVSTTTLRERTAFDGKAFFTALLPGCYVLAAGEEKVRVVVYPGELIEKQIVVQMD